MNDQELKQKAEKIVEAKLGFYKHVLVYIVCNIGLIAINFVTSPEYLWFKWALIGWGIGLASHGIDVFTQSRFSSLKKSMMDKEMENLRKEKEL